MTQLHNQKVTPTQMISLSQLPTRWNWITLSGPDAKDFLHRLTTAHLKFLKPGQGAPGCFLTAQGKIRVYFRLWVLAPDSYAFELDAGKEDHWKQALLSVIDQFHFGEKMTLTDRTSELGGYWIFPSGAGVLSLETKTEGEVQINFHGTKEFGRPWISAWGPSAALKSWIAKNCPDAASVSIQDLETWRVQNLTPGVDHEITEAVLPLEIGLQNAIANNKGCYPGQEVIEKIISLGAPPRRLALIEGHGAAPQPQSVLYAGDTPSAEIGKVTSVAASVGAESHSFTALAIVRKTHARTGVDVRFHGPSHDSGSVGRIVKIAD